MKQTLGRREFMWRSTAAAAGCLLAGAGCATSHSRRASARVMTVRGPVPARDLGPMLPHEHVFLDFIGADKVRRDRYDPEDVFKVALPQLQLLKDFGCQSMAECTPAFIGRDPLLLRRLAEAADLHLLTNTGYYGAGNNRYLPRHAFTETANELSARWLLEWRDGIEGTEVRPGFIKIGVGPGRLSDVHRTLVRAAARTHLASGLVIASHTEDGEAALDQLATLREEGVLSSAFIWVHAQSEKNNDVAVLAAEQGAWVEFDNVSSKTIDRHLELVKRMKDRGLLKHTLVSHDAGWYEAGKPGGGEFRSYDTLFKTFLPALKEAGVSQAEIQQLIVVNPREAFTLRVRSTHGIERTSPE